MHFPVGGGIMNSLRWNSCIAMLLVTGMFLSLVPIQSIPALDRDPVPKIVQSLEYSDRICDVYLEQGSTPQDICFPEQVRAVFVLPVDFDAERFVDAIPTANEEGIHEYHQWGYLDTQDAIYEFTDANGTTSYRRYGSTELYPTPLWYACDAIGKIVGAVDSVSLSLASEDTTVLSNDVDLPLIMSYTFAEDSLFHALVNWDKVHASKLTRSKEGVNTAINMARPDASGPYCSVHIQASPSMVPQLLAEGDEPNPISLALGITSIDTTAANISIACTITVKNLASAVQNYGGTFKIGNVYSAEEDAWTYTDIATVVGKNNFPALKTQVNLGFSELDLFKKPIVFTWTQNASKAIPVDQQLTSQAMYPYQGLPWGQAFYDWFYGASGYKSTHFDEGISLSATQMVTALSAFFSDYATVLGAAVSPIYINGNLSALTLKATQASNMSPNYSGRFVRIDNQVQTLVGTAFANKAFAGVSSVFQNIQTLSYSQITSPYYIEMTGFLAGGVTLKFANGSGVMSNPFYLLDAVSEEFRAWLSLHYPNLTTTEELMVAIGDFMKTESGIAVYAEANTPGYNGNALTSVVLQVTDIERADDPTNNNNKTTGQFARIDNPVFDTNETLIGGTPVFLGNAITNTLANLKYTLNLSANAPSWEQLNAPYYYYLTSAKCNGFTITGSNADPIAVGGPIYLLDAVNLAGKPPFREWLKTIYMNPDYYAKSCNTYSELTAAIEVYRTMREANLGISLSGGLNLQTQLTSALPAAGNQFTWQLYEGGTWDRATETWSGGSWEALNFSGNPLSAGTVSLGTLLIPQEFRDSLNDLSGDDLRRGVRCVVYDAKTKVTSYSNVITLAEMQGANNNADRISNIQNALQDPSLDYARFLSFYYGNIAKDYAQNGDSRSGLQADGSVERNNFLLLHDGVPITGLGFWDAQSLIDVLNHIIDTYGAEMAKEFFHSFQYDLYDPNFSSRGGCGLIYHNAVNQPEKVLAQASGGTPDWADETLQTTHHAYPKDAKTPFHLVQNGGVEQIEYPNEYEGYSFFNDLSKSATPVEGKERSYTIALSANATGDQRRPVVLLFQIQTSWQMFDLLHANDLASLVNNNPINYDLASLYELKKAFEEFFTWADQNGVNNVCVGITNFQHNGTFNLLGFPYFTNDMGKLRTSLYGWDTFGDCEHIHYGNAALLNANGVLANGATNGVFANWQTVGGTPAYSKAEMISIIVGGACEAADLNKPYLPNLSTNRQYGIRTNSGILPGDEGYTGYQGNVSWMDAANQAGKFDSGKYYSYDHTVYQDNGQSFFLDALKDIYKSAERGGTVSNVTITDVVRSEFDLTPSSFAVYVDGKRQDPGNYVITTKPIIVDGHTDTEVSCLFTTPIQWGASIELKFDVRAKDSYIGGASVFTNSGTPDLSYVTDLGEKDVQHFEDQPVVDVPLHYPMPSGGEITIFHGTDYNLRERDANGNPLQDVYGKTLGTEQLAKFLETTLKSHSQVAGELSFQWLQRQSNDTYLPAMGNDGQEAQQSSASIPYIPSMAATNFVSPSLDFWVNPSEDTEYYLHILFEPYTAPLVHDDGTVTQVKSTELSPINYYVKYKIKIIQGGIPIPIRDMIDYVATPDGQTSSASGNSFPSIYLGLLAPLEYPNGDPVLPSDPVTYDWNEETVSTTYEAFFAEDRLHGWIQDKYSFYLISDEVVSGTPTLGTPEDPKRIGTYKIHKNEKAPSSLRIGKDGAIFPLIYGEGILITRPTQNQSERPAMLDETPDAPIDHPVATLDSSKTIVYGSAMADPNDYTSAITLKPEQLSDIVLLKSDLLSDFTSDTHEEALSASIENTLSDLLVPEISMDQQRMFYDYDIFRLALANSQDGNLRLTTGEGDYLTITYPMPRDEKNAPRAWKDSKGAIQGADLVVLHYPEQYHNFQALSNPFDYDMEHPDVYSFADGSLRINANGDLELDVDNFSPFVVGWSVLNEPFSAVKVDASDHKPLADAKFKLYQYLGPKLEEGMDYPPLSDETAWKLQVNLHQDGIFTSSEDGNVDFGRLLLGTYQLVETQAPTGYLRPRGAWLLTVTEGNISIRPYGDAPKLISNVKEGTWIIPNRTIPLPETGGMGTGILTATGLLLFLSATGLSVLLNKKTRALTALRDQGGDQNGKR